MGSRDEGSRAGSVRKATKKSSKPAKSGTKRWSPAKKTAKKTGVNYPTLSKASTQTFAEWMESTGISVRNDCESSSPKPDERLRLDFDFANGRVQRYHLDQAKTAPFPDGRQLLWRDAIGLFTDEARLLDRCSTPQTTFWQFEPRRHQLATDAKKDLWEQELYALGDGRLGVDFTKPVIHVLVSVSDNIVTVREVLGVPGGLVEGWETNDADRMFALAPLLRGAFEKVERNFGYYAVGSVFTRAIKGDRFEGFTFEAFINCRQGTLRTHSFEWTDI